LGDGHDLHAHAGGWLFDVNNHTLKQIQREFSRSHIDKFAIMPSVPPRPDLSHKTNLSLYTEAREQGVDFIYWLDPRFTKLRELDSVESNLKGVKFHPSYTRTRMTSKRMVRFLEWCESNSKPLIVHCGRWNKYANYKYAVEVATEFKGTLILAHMGGPAYDIKTNALDFIASQKLRGRLMVDTSTCFQPYLIEKAVRVLGAGNVIFGSDYPLYHPAPTRLTVEMSRVPEKAKRLILRDNYEAL
jgi:hypothetical protein